MRPRSYARKPTDAHISSRTHSRTYTYIHPCTHTYARIRARVGIFLTPNLLYSIVKPSSIISPIPFTSIIQSLYNPYQYWHHIGYAICTNCQHLTSSVTHLPPITIHPPTIYHLSLISYSLSPLPIISTNPSAYHIPSYLMSIPTHHPINMSVCYKTLSILYILAASSTTVSHLIQITIFTNPTIIIFIMETVFRANHHQFPLCIIIHLLIFVMKFI